MTDSTDAIDRRGDVPASVAHSARRISLADRLRVELSQFRGLWKGGYYEGDPLDPLSKSSYGPIGFMSVLHATYLRCIRPYVGPTTRVVEIGPGKGAWTRTFVECGANEIWCLDALSREHNQFDEYVGRAPHIRYFQVSDFSCRELPNDYFDFFFSFGCFCHISPSGIREYLANLRPKLKQGANGFLMVADYDKYNAALADPVFRVNRLLYPQRTGPIFTTWRRVVDALIARKYYHKDFRPKDKSESDVPDPGRFYHMGTQETSLLLEALGYEVVAADVGTIYRDPVVHFRKTAGV